MATVREVDVVHVHLRVKAEPGLAALVDMGHPVGATPPRRGGIRHDRDPETLQIPVNQGGPV
jgi:hypothetical protein